jgi:hypothetical protein
MIIKVGEMRVKVSTNFHNPSALADASAILDADPREVAEELTPEGLSLVENLLLNLSSFSSGAVALRDEILQAVHTAQENPTQENRETCVRAIQALTEWMTLNP